MGNPQDLLNSKDGVYSTAEMYYAAVSYPCMRDAHGQCTLNERFCQCACHQRLGISVPRPMEQVQAEVKAEIDAVLAERERCAKIVETAFEKWLKEEPTEDGPGWEAGGKIAAMIRGTE